MMINGGKRQDLTMFENSNFALELLLHKAIDKQEWTHFQIQLFKISYTPKAGVRNLYSSTCVFPHEELSTQYNRVLTLARQREHAIGAYTEKDDLFAYKILYPTSKTSNWYQGSYEYRLMKVKKEKIAEAEKDAEGNILKEAEYEYTAREVLLSGILHVV